MTKKELKTNWYNCRNIVLIGLSFYLSSCAKKINPYHNMSLHQCVSHALNMQVSQVDLHGEIKITIKTLDQKKINLLADFQLASDGKMLLSLDKLGFTIALASINNEEMYLWLARQKQLYHGSVEQGLDRVFAVSLTMQDILNLIYVSWKKESLLNIKDNNKTIFFEDASGQYEVSKKDCLLKRANMKRNTVSIDTVEYINLPSKKRLAKTVQISDQSNQVKLQFNQVYEQALNQKKWKRFEERFRALSKNQPAAVK